MDHLYRSTQHFAWPLPVKEAPLAADYCKERDWTVVASHGGLLFSVGNQFLQPRQVMYFDETLPINAVHVQPTTAHLLAGCTGNQLYFWDVADPLVSLKSVVYLNGEVTSFSWNAHHPALYAMTTDQNRILFRDLRIATTTIADCGPRDSFYGNARGTKGGAMATAAAMAVAAASGVLSSVHQSVYNHTIHPRMGISPVQTSTQLTGTHLSSVVRGQAPRGLEESLGLPPGVVADPFRYKIHCNQRCSDVQWSPVSEWMVAALIERQRIMLWDVRMLRSLPIGSTRVSDDHYAVVEVTDGRADWTTTRNMGSPPASESSIKDHCGGLWEIGCYCWDTVTDGVWVCSYECSRENDTKLEQESQDITPFPSSTTFDISTLISPLKRPQPTGWRPIGGSESHINALSTSTPAKSYPPSSQISGVGSQQTGYNQWWKSLGFKQDVPPMSTRQPSPNIAIEFWTVGTITPTLQSSLSPLSNPAESEDSFIIGREAESPFGAAQEKFLESYLEEETWGLKGTRCEGRQLCNVGIPYRLLPHPSGSGILVISALRHVITTQGRNEISPTVLSNRITTYLTYLRIQGGRVTQERLIADTHKQVLASFWWNSPSIEMSDNFQSESKNEQQQELKESPPDYLPTWTSLMILDSDGLLHWLRWLDGQDTISFDNKSQFLGPPRISRYSVHGVKSARGQGDSIESNISASVDSNIRKDSLKAPIRRSITSASVVGPTTFLNLIQEEMVHLEGLVRAGILEGLRLGTVDQFTRLFTIEMLLPAAEQWSFTSKALSVTTSVASSTGATSSLQVAGSFGAGNLPSVVTGVRESSIGFSLRKEELNEFGNSSGSYADRVVRLSFHFPIKTAVFWSSAYITLQNCSTAPLDMTTLTEGIQRDAMAAFSKKARRMNQRVVVSSTAQSGEVSGINAGGMFYVFAHLARQLERRVHKLWERQYEAEHPVMSLAIKQSLEQSAGVESSHNESEQNEPEDVYLQYVERKAFAVPIPALSGAVFSPAGQLLLYGNPTLILNNGTTNSNSHSIDCPSNTQVSEVPVSYYLKGGVTKPHRSLAYLVVHKFLQSAAIVHELGSSVSSSQVELFSPRMSTSRTPISSPYMNFDKCASVEDGSVSTRERSNSLGSSRGILPMVGRSNFRSSLCSTSGTPTPLTRQSLTFGLSLWKGGGCATSDGVLSGSACRKEHLRHLTLSALSNDSYNATRYSSGREWMDDNISASLAEGSNSESDIVSETSESIINSNRKGRLIIQKPLDQEEIPRRVNLVHVLSLLSVEYSTQLKLAAAYDYGPLLFSFNPTTARQRCQACYYNSCVAISLSQTSLAQLWRMLTLCVDLWGWHNSDTSSFAWEKSILGRTTLILIVSQLLQKRDTVTLCAVLVVLGGSHVLTGLWDYGLETALLDIPYFCEHVKSRTAFFLYSQQLLASHVQHLRSHQLMLQAAQIQTAIIPQQRLSHGVSTSLYPPLIPTMEEPTELQIAVMCGRCIKSETRDLLFSPGDLDIQIGQEMDWKRTLKHHCTRNRYFDNNSFTGIGAEEYRSGVTSSDDETTNNDFPPMICNSCDSEPFVCSVCLLTMRKNILSLCGLCGHGGHPNHMEEWFSQYSECPSGCGCLCTESMDVNHEMDLLILFEEGQNSSAPAPLSANSRLHMGNSTSNDCSPADQAAQDSLLRRISGQIHQPRYLEEVALGNNFTNEYNYNNFF